MKLLLLALSMFGMLYGNPDWITQDYITLEGYDEMRYLTVSEVDCAACGSLHRNITITLLRKPIKGAYEATPVFTRWFICPVTGDIVFTIDPGIVHLGVG